VEKKEESAPAAEATRIRNRERVFQMGLGHAGSETRQSIVTLARQITTGGYAIFLTESIVASLGGRAVRR
jgi:hypothetical protein